MRDALFVLVCIPVRILLAQYAHVPYVRIYTAAVAHRYLTGTERAEIGMFGGRVWWNHMRPWHGLTFALASLTGDKRYLIADVMLGVAARAAHAQNQG